MNKELAAYITRLCELSGHTTQIDDDLILVEPGEDFIYDAFTRRKGYYAYGHVDRYLYGGPRFGSASFEIFKKFAIMHFAADIRAAHQLPPLKPPTSDRRSPRFFHRIPRTHLVPADKQSLPHSHDIHNLLAQCLGLSVVPDGHVKRGPALPRPRTVRGWIRCSLSAVTHMLSHRCQTLMPKEWISRC